MRAQEFISDAVNKKIFTPGWFDEITILNRYRLIARATDDWNKYQKLDIEVFDPENPIPYRIAHARFRIKPGFLFQKNLQASMIYVAPEYQRQGLATAIYQYVRKLGNTIRPSSTQLDPGRAMWKSFNRNNALAKESTNENFADGRKPGRKGLSKRVGIPQKATLGQLEKIAKSSTGERRRMAQWQLNMRRGKAKKNK